jgi:hypothetical protein
MKCPGNHRKCQTLGQPIIDGRISPCLHRRFGQNSKLAMGCNMNTDRREVTIAYLLSLINMLSAWPSARRPSLEWTLKGLISHDIQALSLQARAWASKKGYDIQAHQHLGYYLKCSILNLNMNRRQSLFFPDKISIL